MSIQQATRLIIGGWRESPSALGCLEYVLDRGERLDWFASPMIATCAVLSGLAIVFLVVHELFRAKHPILQLRLLGNRNFALANCMIFFTYFARYASTALLPEFTHSMLGVYGNRQWPCAFSRLPCTAVHPSVYDMAHEARRSPLTHFQWPDGDHLCLLQAE